MVDEGQLTSSEKTELLASLDANIKVLEEEKAIATTDHIG